jgi:hypothetical protein
MPVYLRLYYLKRLKQQYDEENAAYEKATKKSSKLSRPSIKKSNR